ncbi:MAG: hypothetical protein JKY81_02130 [Colwellia sp.]|nr:hypothetical protein [Colwellia sp.]
MESLLAYQVALFLIFEPNPKRLLRHNYLLVEYESSTDFINRFQKFEGRESPRSRSSLISALNKLEEAAVLMSASTKSTQEEVEILGLKKKQYLQLYIDLKSLRDEYPDDVIQYSVTRHYFFDEKYLPLIMELNSLVSDEKMSLLAYQMGLYFIFQLTKDHFEEGDAEFLLKSYDDFSRYFSTFVDVINVPQSTISDNLDKLHETGFINATFVNPRQEFELLEYEDKDHLYILMPLD